MLEVRLWGKVRMLCVYGSLCVFVCRWDCGYVGVCGGYVCMGHCL